MTEPRKIRRAFATVGKRQVHYRIAGSGPAVVMFGQSPVSSQTLDRQTLAFAEHFTAIAVDTAGLGRSSSLNTPTPEIADQAIALAEFLDALGLTKVALYGSHTGASICLEFARRYPERSAIALLDGIPAYSDVERNLRLSTYFQPHPATWDGLHLMWLWYRYREQNIFWPWNVRGRGTRGQCDVPSPEHLHRGLVDILEVGMGYVPPYMAAFRYRAEEAVPHLRSPIVFLSYVDDSLPTALAHLPTLPTCCRVETMPIDREAGVRKEIEILKSAGSWESAPPLSATKRRADGVTRDYVDLPGGQLALRRYGSGAGRPLVILPPAPGSASQLFTLPDLLARDREVVIVDLPGCGDSDALTGVPIDIDAYADAVGQAVERLFDGAVDIYARDGGAAVALALDGARPDRIRKLILDNPPALSEAERTEIAPRYAEPISLTWDGSYLIRLWHATRDQELFWPWYERKRIAIRETDPDIDPDRLTVEVHAYLKHYASYAATWQAVLSYPTADRIEASGKAIVCGDANGKFVPHAKRTAGDAFHDLPASMLARAQSILRLLDQP